MFERIETEVPYIFFQGNVALPMLTAQYLCGTLERATGSFTQNWTPLQSMVSRYKGMSFTSRMS